jgi:hypothetical protein
MSLVIRCEVVGIVDFVAVYHAQEHKHGRSLVVDFSSDRSSCEALLENAKLSKNILQQTEGHIFWAQLAGLECEVMESRETGKSYDQIRALANTHLNSARELCETHPGQTSSVVDEVREVRRLLDEGGYQSQMRMVVAAMSKEFSGTVTGTGARTDIRSLLASVACRCRLHFVLSVAHPLAARTTHRRLEW